MQLHQISSVIKLPIGKGVPKGVLRSADWVNECFSHVQFLTDGEVSNQD